MERFTVTNVTPRTVTPILVIRVTFFGGTVGRVTE